MPRLALPIFLPMDILNDSDEPFPNHHNHHQSTSAASALSSQLVTTSSQFPTPGSISISGLTPRHLNGFTPDAAHNNHVLNQTTLHSLLINPNLHSAAVELLSQVDRLAVSKHPLRKLSLILSSESASLTTNYHALEPLGYESVRFSHSHTVIGRQPATCHSSLSLVEPSMSIAIAPVQGTSASAESPATPRSWVPMGSPSGSTDSLTCSDEEDELDGNGLMRSSGCDRESRLLTSVPPFSKSILTHQPINTVLLPKHMPLIPLSLNTLEHDPNLDALLAYLLSSSSPSSPQDFPTVPIENRKAGETAKDYVGKESRHLLEQDHIQHKLTLVSEDLSTLALLTLSGALTRPSAGACKAQPSNPVPSIPACPSEPTPNPTSCSYHIASNEKIYALPFAAALPEISSIATKILDTPSGTLAAQSQAACVDLIYCVQLIGNSWDDHDECPHCSCQVLEWWDAEKGFWSFSPKDEDDGDKICFFATRVEQTAETYASINMIGTRHALANGSLALPGNTPLTTAKPAILLPSHALLIDFFSLPPPATDADRKVEKLGAIS
ncbi:hypothetical protein PCASD_17603 [Puccinia coronata f. sp. avenae]|uniref:Uncharacterized protein n=1 Tax=Puccinia coronata f. sp. avenae TaxID=200324 RepID=A0A2N5TV29_9BASI|nr:hypothetical protein PCASD_17603 [Puccinia coronata f. sp. avenae]